MNDVSPQVEVTPEAAAIEHSKGERFFNVFGIGAIHFGAVVGLFLGARWYDVAICVGFYWLRMFSITAGYHRYFSHRTFKTSRVFQFLLALLATTATQKGPLWWAATHRRHHRESDQPGDVHSPVQRGFWYSHIGWIIQSENDEYKPEEIKDFYKYPELRWLDRWHVVPVITVIALSVVFGGWRGIAWWYCMSTFFLMHCTFFINSLAHVWGKRVYSTTDDSRNNWFLALLTMGEGWHNNHHRYMQSTNQGFFWWQIDGSYYVLRVLSSLGIVWDIKTPPKRILDEGRQGNPAPFEKMAEKLESALPEALPVPQDAE